MKLEDLKTLSDSGDKYVREVASNSEKLKEAASYISQDKSRVMIFYNSEEDAHYIDALNAIPYVDVQFIIDCTDKECCEFASLKMDCDVIVITENVDRGREDYDECNHLVYFRLNPWILGFY